MTESTTSVAPSRFVITLVHGTWSSADKWPKASRLLTALKANFPQAKIESFSWSGDNDNADRVEAQAGLVEQLQTQLAESPGAKHFVIAHSHGTQVTLYALRHPGLVGRIAAVVGMGSPFLIARPRNTKLLRSNFWSWFEARLGVFLVVLAIGSLWVGAWLEKQNNLPQILNWFLNTVTLSAGLALCTFGTFPSVFRRLRRRCYRPLSQWIRTSQRHTKTTLGFEIRDDTPMFFVTAREDEAYWHLRILGAISQAFVWFYVGCTYSLLVPMALYSIALPLALLGEFLGFSGEGLFLFWAMGFIWLPAIGVALMLFEMFFLPLFASLAAHGAAFGWGGLSTYVWSRVMVYRAPKHCPNLSYHVVKLRPPRFGRLQRGPVGQLSHCAYYEDEASVSAILDWLSKQ